MDHPAVACPDLRRWAQVRHEELDRCRRPDHLVADAALVEVVKDLLVGRPVHHPDREVQGRGRAASALPAGLGPLPPRDARKRTRREVFVPKNTNQIQHHPVSLRESRVLFRVCFEVVCLGDEGLFVMNVETRINVIC